MKDYKESSDEELIVRLREGERDITDYICDKYKGMVKAKAKSMFLLGGGRGRSDTGGYDRTV